MDHKVLDLLNTKIEERKKMLINALADGSSQDFASYQNVCGVVRGLGLAQMELTDLLRNIKDFNDD